MPNLHELRELLGLFMRSKTIKFSPSPQPMPQNILLLIPYLNVLPLFKMPEGKYNVWTDNEEADLPDIMEETKNMKWKDKCEVYFQRTGIRRTISSIRSKLDQMERRAVEGYPSSQSQPRSHQNASQTTQRPLPSFLDRLPSSPPPLKLEVPGPGVRRLLDRWRRVEYRRRYASAAPSQSRKMSRRSSLSPCRSKLRTLTTPRP